MLLLLVLYCCLDDEIKMCIEIVQLKHSI